MPLALSYYRYLFLFSHFLGKKLKTETLEEYKSLEEKEEIGLLKSVLLLPVELLESEDLFTTFTSKEVSAKYEKRSFYYYKFPNWKANNVFFREIVPQRF